MTRASPRPRQITMSAYASAIIALLLIGTIVQAAAYGVAVGAAGVGALAIGAIGLVCTYLLLSLNHFARLGFVVFWLSLVSAAGYSWAFLRSTHDYRGALGMVFLVYCGVV